MGIVGTGAGPRRRASLVAAIAVVAIVALAAGYVVLSPHTPGGVAATGGPTASGSAQIQSPATGVPTTTPTASSGTSAPKSPSPTSPTVWTVDVPNLNGGGTATYFGGKFVLSGFDDQGAAMWVGDGTAWEHVPLPAAFRSYQLRGFAQIGNRLFAFGDVGTWDPYCRGGMGSTCNGIMPVAILYSDDAVTWTSLTPAQLQPFKRAQMVVYAAGSSGAVVVGERCPVNGACATVTWHSADGIHWDAGTVFRKSVPQFESYGTFAALVATPAGFAAIGDPFFNGAPGTASALFSTDGKTWHVAKPAVPSLPAPPDRVGGVAIMPGPGGLVANVCGNLWSSRDGGRTWHAFDGPNAAEPPFGYPFGTIAGDSVRLVVVDSLGTWESRDLATWTRIGDMTSTADEPAPAIVVGPSGVLAGPIARPEKQTATIFLPVPEV